MDGSSNIAPWQVCPWHKPLLLRYNRWRIC